MSADVADSPLHAPTDPAPVPQGATWRLTLHGVRTVAVLELRQRVRSTRWVIVLALWTVILGGLTTMVRFSVHQALDPAEVDGAIRSMDSATAPENAERVSQLAGATMFGIIVFLVLGLASLIAPALTATSVNGDRAAGVLATLQTTLLSAAEIAIGKLLAAWTTALALLVTAAPFILWAYLEGGTSAGRLLVTLALLAVMLLVVCAVALGWSAVAARTSTSAVLTYLSVSFLGLGLPLLFALSMPLVTQEEQVRVIQSVPQPSGTDPNVPDQGQSTYTCVTETQEMPRTHTERVWWLLAANPFVIVADAAPRLPARPGVDRGSDPLSAIRFEVRELRLGPDALENWCTGGMSGYPGPGGDQAVIEGEARSAEVSASEAKRAARREGLGAVWPFGLAADLALGTGFVVLAIRRLRAPARTLPRGTRVA